MDGGKADCKNPRMSYTADYVTIQAVSNKRTICLLEISTAVS